MSKQLLIALLLVVSPYAVAAETANKQLALEYLRVTNMEAIVNASVDSYDEQLLKDAPPEQRARIRGFLEKALGWHATKDQLATLVSELYMEGKLKAFLAFVSTPEGRSFNSKNEEFSKRYAAFAATNVQRALKECCSPPSK